MATADWWARKLGTVPPQPSPNTYYANTTSAPSRSAPPVTATAPTQDVQVTTENIGQLLQYWKGGEGQRNATHCPECGSDKLFRRRVGATEAAPLCYHCGYNGIFRQGDPANWSV